LRRRLARAPVLLDAYQAPAEHDDHAGLLFRDDDHGLARGAAVAGDSGTRGFPFGAWPSRRGRFVLERRGPVRGSRVLLVSLVVFSVLTGPGGGADEKAGLAAGASCLPGAGLPSRTFLFTGPSGCPETGPSPSTGVGGRRGGLRDPSVPAAERAAVPFTGATLALGRASRAAAQPARPGAHRAGSPWLTRTSSPYAVRAGRGFRQAAAAVAVVGGPRLVRRVSRRSEGGDPQVTPIAPCSSGRPTPTTPRYSMAFFPRLAHAMARRRPVSRSTRRLFLPGLPPGRVTPPALYAVFGSRGGGLAATATVRSWTCACRACW